MYNIKVALEKLNKLNFKESTLDLYRCLLKRFQKFLDSKGITNPKLEIFLDFHKTLDGSSSKMFYSLISHIDCLFSMHWTKPGTIVPFTPPSLPDTKRVDEFFHNYEKGIPLPVDYLIVKVCQSLLDQGESKSTVDLYLCVLNRFRWFCLKNGETNFKQKLLDQFIECEKNTKIPTRTKMVSRTKKLLLLIIDNGYLPYNPLKIISKVKPYTSSIEKVRTEYKNYLTNEKGFALASIRKYDSVLRQIFDYCKIKSLAQLKVLSHSDIDKILNEFYKKYCKESLRGQIPVLKGILEYLYKVGLIVQNLSAPIFTCRYIKSYVPPYLTIESQAKLKLALKNATFREKAIVLLALELGLRSCDIVNLKLSNLDFTNQTLKIVQHKTKKPLELPIFSHILDAIDNYIKKERPLPYKDGENIFLSQLPPFASITNIYHYVSKWVNKAEVKSENKNVKGSHLMRYSLVHAMMSSETDKYIITQTLGHSVDSSDRPYLSMEEQMLKSCALDLKLIGLGNGFDEDENV